MRKLATNIKNEPEIAGKFSRIIRSGQYLVFKGLNPETDEESPELQMDEEALSSVVARDVSARTKFSEGDIRVMFEYVRQPKIDFLAQ